MQSNNGGAQKKFSVPKDVFADIIGKREEQKRILLDPHGEECERIFAAMALLAGGIPLLRSEKEKLSLAGLKCMPNKITVRRKELSEWLKTLNENGFAPDTLLALNDAVRQKIGVTMFPIAP